MSTRSAQVENDKVNSPEELNSKPPIGAPEAAPGDDPRSASPSARTFGLGEPRKGPAGVPSSRDPSRGGAADFEGVPGKADGHAVRASPGASSVSTASGPRMAAKPGMAATALGEGPKGFSLELSFSGSAWPANADCPP